MATADHRTIHDRQHIYQSGVSTSQRQTRQICRTCRFVVAVNPCCPLHSQAHMQSWLCVPASKISFSCMDPCLLQPITAYLVLLRVCPHESINFYELHVLQLRDSSEKLTQSTPWECSVYRFPVVSPELPWQWANSSLARCHQWQWSLLMVIVEPENPPVVLKLGLRSAHIDHMGSFQ